MTLWHIYNFIAVLIILSQCLFVIWIIRNYYDTIKKSKKDQYYYLPKTLLTVPCKGFHQTFEKNIACFFNLAYPDYTLHFIVEDASDPAFEKLNALKEKYRNQTNARDVKILIAGKSTACGQKIHNLLHSCNNAPDDVQVFAFADADAAPKPNWLAELVHPLRKEKHGAATGYRWLIPEKNNLPTLILCAINGKIAQLLGNTRFNQAWGGSMAIKAQTFRNLALDKIWANAVSDDLSLSVAVKKAKNKVAFVPACIVPSHTHTDWPGLFEFATRQFRITRIYAPKTWLLGLASSVYSLAGFWLTLAVFLFAALNNKPLLPFYLAVPLVFLTGQIIRAILRQKMIAAVLTEEKQNMKPAALADIIGNCIWSWILFACILASAFGRKISWSGITYIMKSPAETIVIRHPD